MGRLLPLRQRRAQGPEGLRRRLLHVGILGADHALHVFGKGAMISPGCVMGRSSVDLDAIRRRVARELGRRGRGQFVAIDRKTGNYLVARDLDALAVALGRAPGKRANFHIVRLGYRAAIELRGRR
jgi:hypothetical protein